MSVGGFAREQRLSLLIRPVSGVEGRDRASTAPAVEIRGHVVLVAGFGRPDPPGLLPSTPPTETSVAMLLADGLTTDEVAQALGIRLNTVRVHLRGIFAKTGVDWQSALVRLLMNSVATLA